MTVVTHDLTFAENIADELLTFETVLGGRNKSESQVSALGMAVMSLAGCNATGSNQSSYNWINTTTKSITA